MSAPQPHGFVDNEAFEMWKKRQNVEPTLYPGQNGYDEYSAYRSGMSRATMEGMGFPIQTAR